MNTAAETLTTLKLELLCKGIRMDDALKKGVMPRYRFKRASLSEGRCFTLERDGETTLINLAVYEKFVDRSPYFYDHETKRLLKDDKPVCAMQLVEDPAWYLDELGDGTMFGSQVQVHGSNVLATSLTNYCVFKDDSEGCAFCGLTLDRDNKKKNPERLAAVMAAIEKKHPGKYHELNINAGTLRSDDRGAQMYLDAIREIRKVSNIMLAAQIAPMDDLSWIDQLKEAGLNSLSFNIEVWDDNLRKKIIPGKGHIPKEKYLEALAYAGKVFGGLNVSSWLIGGLEPPASTVAGAEEIARRGVLPFVTVFRPIIGSPLEDADPPAVETMVTIYRRIQEILLKYKLDPKQANSGCAKCDCCAAGREVLALGL